jgi:hypothetical protein
MTDDSLVSDEGITHNYYPEDGRVAVSIQRDDVVDVLQFNLVEPAGRRVVMDGSHDWDGPERTLKDRGELVGSVLEFDVRRRFHRGRIVHSVPQEVPGTVEAHLSTHGADEVRR